MSYYLGTDGPVTTGPRNAAIARLRAVQNVANVSEHVILFSINHVIWSVDLTEGINDVFQVVDLVVAQLAPYQFKYISSSI